jgi:Glycosyl transferase family 21
MTVFLALWLFGQSFSVLLIWHFTWQLGRSPLIITGPRVVVVVAVKGHGIQFDDFLEHLFEQDYPNYRVIFAVESEHDPAVAAIERRRAADPERVKLVIAGLSVNEGQKVTNLRTALATTTPADEILVFADADISPNRDWLRRLVEPVSRAKADVVTAYPWLVVRDRRLSTLVLASISASVATLPRLPLLNVASGSSIAMRRERFFALGILDAWCGAISDDLQLTNVVRRAKGSIVKPYELLLRTSATTCSFRDVISQAQRWYMLIRIYMPALYGLAIFGATVIAAGWIGGALCAIAGRIDGAITLLLGIGLAFLRTRAQAALIARIWGKAALEENRLFLMTGPFVNPLAAVANAALAWSSLLLHSTTWAGITYEVRGPQATKILSRSKG